MFSGRDRSRVVIASTSDEASFPLAIVALVLSFVLLLALVPPKRANGDQLGSAEAFAAR